MVGVNGSDSRIPVSVTSFDVTGYYGLNTLQMKDLILAMLSAGWYLVINSFWLLRCLRRGIFALLLKIFVAFGIESLQESFPLPDVQE